jgi:parallel beta-helix repeat protein
VIDGGGGQFDGLVLGAGSSGTTGSSGSTIKGLGIEDFNGDGILVESSNNLIGGSIAGDGDVISGNTGDGIRILATANQPATGNQVEGDFIGTDASGTFAQPNGGNGIEIQADSNTIGGSIAGARGAFSGPGNLISGNKNDGILIEASKNVVEGDFIGTNASGTGPLLYQVNGVVVQSSDNTIGGPTAAYGNLVSGNQNDGVLVGNIGIHVANNTIGTNIAGKGPVPNVGNGVEVTGTSGAPAAPPAADPDVVSYNLISDNSGYGGIPGYGGILLDDNASDVLVQGNKIGTDASGTFAQPNANGVVVSGVGGNTIGGSTPDLGNTISGNTNGIGIEILNGGATDNTVEGNLIGTNLNGDGAVGNSVGISISNAPNNLIGGLTATAGTGVGNVITGNTSIGIEISNNTSSGNLIEGNLLGLYKDGKHFFSEPNMLTTGIPIGILIDNAPNNTISGAIAADGSIIGAGDVITGFGVGVDISGFNATGNAIEGDRIGTTSGGAMIAGVPGIGIGVYINDVPSNTVGGSTAGAGNTIMGYAYYGVYIYGTLAHGNVIQSDRIGPPAVKNKGQLAGIAIDGASDNVLGGSTSSAGNTISGNAYAGIYIFGSSASGNVIRQNHLEHNGYGILLYNAINNGGYATLLNRNRFVRDGIANVRIFQGAVPSGQASSHPARSKGHKSSLHVAIHRTPVHGLRTRPESHRAEVSPADQVRGGAGVEERGPVSTNESVLVRLRRRTHPAAVPRGPLAHRTRAIRDPVRGLTRS